MNYQNSTFFFSPPPASKNKEGKLDLLLFLEQKFVWKYYKKLINTQSPFFEIKKNKVKQNKSNRKLL